MNHIYKEITEFFHDPLSSEETIFALSQIRKQGNKGDGETYRSICDAILKNRENPNAAIFRSSKNNSK